ncbi:MAG: acetyltransferase [Chloroflexi bacterium]|nr:acetyltransferase [Chloroflexota bacterium]
MSQQRVLVYGAGGHGKVVVDILERMGRYEIAGIVDDDHQGKGLRFLGYPILGGLDTLLEHGSQSLLVLAIGDNEARDRLAHRLEPLGFQFVTAVHPTASVGRDVKLGWGTVVMANVAINSGVTIGRHVIVNTGATIDHDCVIGDFAHISPGAHLGGGVTVGPLAHVGIGVSVIQDVTIGARSVIGAGAAVVEDVPPNVTAVGVPARVVRTRQQGDEA